MTRRQANALDDKIEAIFKSLRPGPIPMLSISSIFKAGRKAHEEGGDVVRAVTAATRAAEADAARTAGRP